MRRVEIGRIRKRCHEYLDGEQCYRKLREIDFEYGSTFQGIKEMSIGAKEVCAQILIPDPITDSLSDYIKCPAVKDTCFQAMLTIGFF